MSLKQLFISTPVIDSSKISEVESSDGLISEFAKSSDRYVPDIDYSDPSNFVRFGLAEEYYKDAGNRILDFYPYDGSTKEKLEWQNGCIDLDLYVLKNLWPKSTGYVNFSPNGWGTDVSNAALVRHRLSNNLEYITFKTGPNVDNFYESSSAVSRVGNFYLDSYKGNTIEFWLKKAGFPSTDGTENITECILHLVPTTGTEELRISTYTGSYASPSAGYAGLYLNYNDSTYFNTHRNCIILDNAWHHYVLSFKYESGTAITTKFYRDGLLISQQNSGVIANATCYKPYKGIIGAIAKSLSEAGSTVPIYSGKLSGSLDELRIWNCCRTSEEIYKYYNFTMGGGTNTDDANLNLGVYFKFNEGITGVSVTDSVVLDYSGRNSNGLWTGYSAQSRETGSAIVVSGASTIEISDPIIRVDHPAVIQLQANLEASGSLYDGVNINNIYNFVPAWIHRENEEEDNPTTKNLLQIAATVLDEFHIKMEKLKELKIMQYKDNNTYKNNPFLGRMLVSRDFGMSEMFLNSSFFEQINSQDETVAYEENINNIKNFIYQNIYNNLINIYKSKGTEYSIRNLMNNFGINSELVKFNLYANNATYDLGTTNYENKIAKKKYVKFSTNNSAYISSSGSFKPRIYGSGHFEVDIYFPKLNDLDSSFYNPNNILESSLLSTKLSNGDNFYELTFRKLSLESKHGQFVLYYSDSEILISEVLYDVYNNKRWTIIFGKYYENDGMHADLDLTTTRNKEFMHCLSEDVDSFFDSAQLNNPLSEEYYLQAGKNSFFCDIDISGVRAYGKNYNPDEGRAKFKDVNNYGTLRPQENKSIWTNEYIPQDQTLQLNWVFDAITGSDDSGKIYVEDFSSGSAVNRYGTDSLGYSEGSYHHRCCGTGSDFLTNSVDIIETKQIWNSQIKLPENLCSSDMIKIISTNEYETFKRDMRPINYIYSLERSYYQNISQEMINIFASITAFNNILGEPVQKFRNEYKSLNRLRSLFYEKVQNIPDIEKYVIFYRWIDKSITDAIMGLVPASTNIIEDNEIIVESHVLERSKYRNKFMNFSDKRPATLMNITGIGRPNYVWDEKGAWWAANKQERGVGRIPVKNGSVYQQQINNIYSAKISCEQKNPKKALISGITIKSIILNFKS